MDILQYFPSYPSIENEDFYQQLYEKKEMNNLKTEKSVSNIYKNHQTFISRFLSPWTNEKYHSILMIHDTGTGKSASISAILNGLKSFDPNTKMLYLTNNETLENNFKKELLKRCPYIQEKRRLSDRFHEKSFFKSENIFFNTFSSFANEISKMSKFSIMKKYQNYFIVLDEAHHLVSESMNVYEKIHSFIHVIMKKRVCVSTATPMRDNLLESLYLLNLVLPLKENIPTGDDFIKEYLIRESMSHLENYSVEKLENYKWKNENVQKQFLEKIKGYVSVFRQKSDNVEIKFCGSIVKPMEYVPIVSNFFDSFQEKCYIKAFSSDVKNPNLEKDADGSTEKYSNFYSNSVQASLMVFPNGSWGTKDTTHYLVNNDSFTHKFFVEAQMSDKTLTREQLLEKIKNFSIIYYNVIKDIIDPKNQNKCFYVYCEKINGSGILRLINLLIQKFSYNLVKSDDLDWNVKRNRCVFLNEKEGVKINIMKQLELFNDKRNRHGEYIRVIFGTDKTREGITLKNIQKIHILTPGWNFGKKNQAVGRGIRLYSHQDLENPSVDINLHCGLIKNKPMYNSVNFLQYIRSEIKEKNIFLFSYAFLTSAVDCQINYLNNFRHADDYSADCFFKPCHYKCEGITNTEPKHLDDGNFNTFYYKTQLPNVIDAIMSEIVEHHLYTFFWQEIKDIIKRENWNDFLIFQSLQQIIEAPIPIQKKDGTMLFLNQEKDYFYTSTTQQKTHFSNGYLSGEQQRQVQFTPNLSIENIQNELFEKEEIFDEKMSMFRALLSEIQETKTKEKIESLNQFFDTFPEFIQNEFLVHTPQKFLSYFGKTTTLDKNTVLLERNKRTKKIDYKTLGIEDYANKTPDTSAKQSEKEHLLIHENPYQIYAIVKNGTFKIRDISDEVKKGTTKSKTLGQNCSSTPLDKIFYYIIVLSDLTNEAQFQKIKNDLDTLLSLSPKMNSVFAQISKMSQEEVVNFYEKESSIFQTFMIKKELTIEEMKMFSLLKLLGLKRSSLCKFLYSLFEQKQLIFFHK